MKFESYRINRFGSESHFMLTSLGESLPENSGRSPGFRLPQADRSHSKEKRLSICRIYSSGDCRSGRAISSKNYQFAPFQVAHWQARNARATKQDNSYSHPPSINQFKNKILCAATELKEVNIFTFHNFKANDINIDIPFINGIQPATTRFLLHGCQEVANGAQW